MSNKYRTIVAAGPYQAEIYDGCYARLESNGRRFRLRVDGTKWVGNSGGFHEYRRYLDRAEGRALLRRYRLAVISEMTGKCRVPGWHNYDGGMTDGYQHCSPQTVLVEAL